MLNTVDSNAMVRAGYSDRTAALLAQIADLAYIKFEDRTERDLRRIALEIREAESFEAGEALLKTNIDKLKESENSLDLKQQLKNLGLDEFRVYNNPLTHTQTILAWSGPDVEIAHTGKKVAILAFRGSEMVPDGWIRNFSLGDMQLHDDGNCFQVHQGFFEGFKSVQKTIEQDLKDLLNGNNGYGLYITGHSLGSALAMIATHQITHKNNTCDPQHATGDEHLFDSEIESNRLFGCYTFGAPRVAGEGFAQSIKPPVYRIVHANDIVARVPPVIVPFALRKIIEFAGNWLPLASYPLKKLLPYLIAVCAPFKTWKGKLLVSRDILSVSEPFVHHGDMRYIRKRPNSQGQVLVLSNPSLWTLFRKWLDNWDDWQSLYKDHELKTYVSKLKKYSSQRNSQP